MSHEHDPRSGRADACLCPGLPPGPTFTRDAQRAPITFAWFLYAQGRFVAGHHLETLYRLDRVGARVAAADGASALQPSEYYGQSSDMLRELLRVRQHALLPRAPAGCRWIGPQLIEEVALPALRPSGGLERDPPDQAPQDANARLQFARTLAQRILRQRASS